MFTEKQAVFFHALSSIHAGSGSEVGIVDLPIQRERHTGFPKIEGSTLKGAIRAAVEAMKGEVEQENIIRIFGSPNEHGEGSRQKPLRAAAVAISDARVLLFPVKSMRGVFAWVSSPWVLKRFFHEMEMYLEKKPPFALPQENTVFSERLLVGDRNVVLEEYTYSVHLSEDKGLARWLGEILHPEDPSYVSERLVILPDDDFADFVQLSTEVNARIQVSSKTGTVEGTALWYEENIPPGTVFYSFLFSGNARLTEEQKKSHSGITTASEVLDYLKKDENFPPVFQLGGNYTLGQGMIHRIWLEKEGV